MKFRKPCLRGKVVLVHVSSSPQDISEARDNIVDCEHALRGYLAPLTETSRGQCFSCEPGTVSSLTPKISLPLEITRLM